MKSSASGSPTSSVRRKGWSTQNDGDGAPRLAVVDRQPGAADFEPHRHRRADSGDRLGLEAIQAEHAAWFGRQRSPRSVESRPARARGSGADRRGASARRCRPRRHRSPDAAGCPDNPEGRQEHAGLCRALARYDEAAGRFAMIEFARRHPRLIAAAVLALLPLAAGAQAALRAVALKSAADGVQTYSLTFQILILMTMLTLLPAILLAMTAFTRIIIVLSILRQALGMATTPSNQVLTGLALFLTFFVMGATLEQSYASGVKPYLDGQLAGEIAIDRTVGPLKKFMLAQTRENDLQLFSRLSGKPQFATPEEVPLSVLVPTFLTSELKTAFQIGFMVFIPFLVIDLVVASVLMSMGMMMLSPVLVSLPFKIMLFVVVDGWTLLIGTLASSFHQ